MKYVMLALFGLLVGCGAIAPDRLADMDARQIVQQYYFAGGERREQLLHEIADRQGGWDDWQIEAVRNKRLRQGMNATQVAMSWGWPTRRNPSSHGVVWVYDRAYRVTYVRFDQNNVVVSWQSFAR